MRISRIAYQAYADVVIIKPTNTTNEKIIIKPRKDTVEISAAAKQKYKQYKRQ